MNCAPDWSENAKNGQHLWSMTSSSSDCYIGESQCTRRGVKHKCSTCKIIIHSECIPLMGEKNEVCKLTFKDVDVRMYRDETTMKHHWVRRKLDTGKCNSCMKSLSSKKLAFGSRELVTVCLWCKTAYHSRESCFNDESNSENCSMGYHSNIIVPPCWILKLPKKGNFKSSIKQSPLEKVGDEKPHEEFKAFVIKPIPVANVHPVVVFINPKSGGNQGVKLLQKFQWLLNPRQVFDLTQGGPGKGLQLYKRVPYLRVLACGGDGTVGWVLSVIDKIGFSPPPAVGVLPLGTGNDLARALGWGGGYTDEPISKILANVGKSDVIQLDRWILTVEKNSDASSEAGGVDHLPLNVINNYFSFGVDAHIALEFHQAREARPDKFNSRLRNKMFYGQRGGKDLVRRKWKDLAEFVTLHCDEKDYTPVLKEHKFHAIVFLNIPSYGGGTRPWAKSSEQSTEDGLIEVVGLTTFQLPLLQAGSHGSSICQCKSAKIVTTKTIPMQVDGEACKLNPSIITLNLLNKAFMLAKKKRGRNSLKQSNMDNLKVKVNLLSMSDYELYHNDNEHLKNIAIAIGDLEVAPEADLDLVRVKTNELISKKFPGTKLSSDWCFIDSCTTECFFRIDRAQENLHFLTDIATDELYILNSFQEESDIETAYPSPSSNHGSTEVKDDKKDIRHDKSNEVTSDKYNKKSGKLANVERSKYRVVNTNVIRDPKQKSSNKLLEAASIGDIRRLKELHAEGCSLLTTDANGQTALHYAACYDQREVIKYLIVSAPQAILNMVDNNNGQTALHKAVISKHQKICCMLLAAGASLTIRDFSGKRPRDFANDMEIALYLHCQEGFLNNASSCD